MHALLRAPWPHLTGLLIAILFVALPGVALPGVSAWGSEPTVSLEVSERFQRLVTELVRGTIPHNYQEEDDWGTTKNVVRGLYIKREGLHIKTHRTRKPVNHGTWKRYRIDLLDPAQQFQVRLQRVRTLPDNRVAFDILCDAKVRAFGRLSQWQHGVQLISLSAEADADVRLTMQCDLATRIKTTGTIPDLELDPVVRHADLQIESFRMREISQLDGPLIKLLSASVREVLEDEIVKRRSKIVAKINRQIDKNREHLRLSVTELLAPAAKESDESTAAGK